VFYIGIGSDSEYKRAYSKQSRNTHWNNIIKITSYEVEIILEDLTWEEACTKEIELIKLYGRKDLNEGTLCNLTDGGSSGTIGMIHTKETKNLMSINKKGKPSGIKQSKETIEKRIGSLRGKPRSEEVKQKIKESKKNISQETKQKLSAWQKGIPKSEQSKKKLSETMLLKWSLLKKQG
jgi:hypothetical protein